MGRASHRDNGGHPSSPLPEATQLSFSLCISDSHELDQNSLRVFFKERLKCGPILVVEERVWTICILGGEVSQRVISVELVEFIRLMQIKIWPCVVGAQHRKDGTS